LDGYSPTSKPEKMPKLKKKEISKQAEPVKTDQFYTLRGKKIPLYSFPENSIIDGEKYLPLLSEIKLKGRCLVVRREDLMPKSLLQLPSLSAIHPFGITLYDTFKPTYGSAPNTEAGRFSLFYCKPYYISSNYWFFWNIDEKPGNYFQGISMYIDTTLIPNPHLRVNLGVTTKTDSAILSISCSTAFFRINVTPLSLKSFNFLLAGPIATVSVYLRRDENDPNAMVEIKSFELYDTIFVDPGPLQP